MFYVTASNSGHASYCSPVRHVEMADRQTDRQTDRQSTVVVKGRLTVLSVCSVKSMARALPTYTWRGLVQETWPSDHTHARSRTSVLIKQTFIDSNI